MTVHTGRVEGKRWLRGPEVPAKSPGIGPGLVSAGGRSEMPVRPNIEKTWLRTVARTTGGRMVIDP